MFNFNSIKKEEHEIALEKLRLVTAKEILDANVNHETVRLALVEEIGACNNKITLLEEQLKEEKKNRDLMINATVQEQLGEYETKYYHDLHSNLAERADGMQQFQETFFDKLLGTLEKFKSPEAKVMILGKEVFGVDQKAGGGKGGGDKKDN